MTARGKIDLAFPPFLWRSNSYSVPNGPVFQASKELLMLFRKMIKKKGKKLENEAELDPPSRVEFPKRPIKFMMPLNLYIFAGRDRVEQLSSSPHIDIDSFIGNLWSVLQMW